MISFINWAKFWVLGELGCNDTCMAWNELKVKSDVDIYSSHYTQSLFIFLAVTLDMKWKDARFCFFIWRYKILWGTRFPSVERWDSEGGVNSWLQFNWLTEQTHTHTLRGRKLELSPSLISPRLCFCPTHAWTHFFPVFLTLPHFVNICLFHHFSAQLNLSPIFFLFSLRSLFPCLLSSFSFILFFLPLSPATSLSLLDYLFPPPLFLLSLSSSQLPTSVGGKSTSSFTRFLLCSALILPQFTFYATTFTWQLLLTFKCIFNW